MGGKGKPPSVRDCDFISLTAQSPDAKVIASQTREDDDDDDDDEGRDVVRSDKLHWSGRLPLTHDETSIKHNFF